MNIPTEAFIAAAALLGTVGGWTACWLMLRVQRHRIERAAMRQSTVTSQLQEAALANRLNGLSTPR